MGDFVHSDSRPETKAFIGLLVSHQRRILAFILSQVPSLADAEDIFQETLVEMWSKFNRFEQGTDFVAWAVTIAKFKILSFRKKNHSKRFFCENLSQVLEAEAFEGLHQMESHLDELAKCLGKLRMKEKYLLKLRYEMNLTFQKIAEQMGISPQGIHRIISHIHARLAQCVRLTLHLEETE